MQNEQAGELIKKEIAEELWKVCNRLNMKSSIYFSNDIYSGEFAYLAPDILFEINDFECSIQPKFSKHIYEDSVPTPNDSGSHKRSGIFIAYGPDIKEGIQIQGTTIYDIAPTVLHMFGLPVPDNMDGRVLSEIFREDSEPAQRKVRYQAASTESARLKNKVRKLKEFGKL